MSGSAWQLLQPAETGDAWCSIGAEKAFSSPAKQINIMLLLDFVSSG